MKNWNKTILFLLLTFFTSYSMAGLFVLSGESYGSKTGTILAISYMFVPALCVLVIEKGIHRNHIKTPLLISFKLNSWFLFAWLITPIISFLTFGISLLLNEVSYSPEMTGLLGKLAASLTPEQIDEMEKAIDTLPFHPIWLTLFQGLIAGITINAFAGFGEELGWRGFLLRQYQHLSFLSASLRIGFIWGIWHAPIILMGHNYAEHPQIGVAMMTVWCILLTPLFLYVTLKSKSVIAASVMHGTLNATAGLSIMLIEGGNDLTVGFTGISGFAALLIILIFLWIYDQWVSGEKVMTGKINDQLDSVN